MASENMDILTAARARHAVEVAHASTVDNLEKAYERAIEADDLDAAAQFARMKRDRLLLDVDAHGSVYRLELEAPEGDSFSAWLPVLRQLIETFADPWAEYRRKLLDVPQQDMFPLEIDWPEKPE